MTKNEKDQALRMLDEIEPAIPVTGDTIVARVMVKALREVIGNSHGAASHAGKARRGRRAKTAGAAEVSPA